MLAPNRTPAGLPRRAAGLLTAGLGLLLVLALMAALQDGLNPDWLGYAAIYDDAGAWLAEQGRDPLFLLVMGTASALLGPDGYPNFRALLGLYFALFTWWLLRRPWPLPAGGRRPLLLLLGLLPFVAPRFTIQIREGLALTLVLAGTVLLCRGGPSSRPGSAGSSLGLALALFVAGTAMHSAAGLLLLALLAGLAVQHLCAAEAGLELWLLLCLGLAATVAGAAVATVWLASATGQALIDDWYGALADDDAAVTAAKWAYWAAYGLGVMALAGRVRRLYEERRLPTGLRPLLGVVTLVMLPAIYVTALLLLGLGLPAIVVSGAARAMNMLLSVSLLLLALHGVLNKRLGLFCLLVLVDQARIIAEALLGPGGGGPP